nr:hypothetical protein [Methylocapsa aurea]
MSDNWEYQLRIKLGDKYADIARSDPGNEAIRPIVEILIKHNAALKSQYDAFADYVSEAEKQGVEHFPLYKWTKATIEDPAKKAKHIASFAVYVDGSEVYAKAIADALEEDLRPLISRGLVLNLSKHDTNPANNPQPPSHLA